MTDLPPTDLTEQLSSYIPALVRQRMLLATTPTDYHHSEQFLAVALFADVAGFTNITEQLMTMAQSTPGTSGAEVLSNVLNGYFGQLIEMVNAHGGDVFKFAGDALTALWPVRSAMVNAPEATLAVNARRAVQCALAIQQKLNDYEAAAGVRMSLRIGIGVGTVFLVRVGGIFGRWEILLAGDPLVQMNLAKNLAQPGQVMLSPESWQLLAPYCEGQLQPDGSVRVQHLEDPLPVVSLDVPDVPSDREAQLRAYIPGAVLSRLSGGQPGWLGELRRVTAIFVNLPALSHTSPQGLEFAQELMQTLQRAIYRFEGSVNKLSVDDKGVLLLAALGLPPMAHEDDPVRAIQAAFDINQALTQMGVAHSIGLATGTVFCGSVGSGLRREYTMMGSVINLAARLMQAAANLPHDMGAPILCDAETMHSTRGRVRFDPLPPAPLKGFAQPVLLFHPQELVRTALRSKVTLVGRQAEREHFSDVLQDLLRGGDGGLIVLEGEAGIGKSRLVADLLEKADAFRVPLLLGAGEAIEQDTPYYAWREVYASILGLNPGEETLSQRQNLLGLLAQNPDLYQLAPLLSAVLPFEIPDNDLTAQMDGEVRSENTRELLTRLLQSSVARGGKVLVLEDAHWLDSASWGLLLRVSQRVKPLQIVLVLRPLTAEQTPPEINRLLKSTTAYHMQLENLPPNDVLTLIAQRLGVTDLPPMVADLILDKAEGNPFFSEELAYALRDTGVLQINEGVCRLAPNVNSLTDLDLPDTIQGVITARIDRLPPEPILVLKVSSVIGRVFPYRTLYDVFPIDSERKTLKAHLQRLEELDITPLETPEPDLSYLFKHIITRDVAYNLMLYGQRQQLHAKVAEWYEVQHADELSPMFSLLAYHWRQAALGSPPTDPTRHKAIDYLEKAGEQALRNYANREAIHYFEDALRVLDESNDQIEIPPSRKARWLRNLADAYQGVGEFLQARRYYEMMLALLDNDPPDTVSDYTFRLPVQVVRQLWSLFRPVRGSRSDDPRNIDRLEAARAYSSLGENYFYDNQIVPAIHASLSALNLAEQVGDSAELTQAYGSMAVAAALVPYRRLAEAYSQRAISSAKRLDHAPSLGFAWTATAAYHAGFGHWALAIQGSENATEIYARLGDWRRHNDIMPVKAQALYHTGRYAESAACYAEVHKYALQIDNRVQQAWGLNGQALNLLRMGDITQAMSMNQQAGQLLQEAPSRTEDIVNAGLSALGSLLNGNYESARHGAVRGLALIGDSPPALYSMLEGFASLAHALLSVWQRESNSTDVDPELPRLATEAVGRMQVFARVFAIGKPRWHLYQGWLARLNRQSDKAAQHWESALKHANALEMPLEQGLTHAMLGLHHPNPTTRKAHWPLAEAKFAELGAAHLLAQLTALPFPPAK